MLQLDSNIHQFSYKGYECTDGNGRDFVKCTCGAKIYYRMTFDDPYEIFKAHQRRLSVQTKHEYNGKISLYGIDYVSCSCGWQKKLKHSKNPENVWEGHKGQISHTERKQTYQAKKKTHWWSSYDYREASWPEIESIAKEVFGGVIYCPGN